MGEEDKEDEAAKASTHGSTEKKLSQEEGKEGSFVRANAMRFRNRMKE